MRQVTPLDQLVARELDLEHRIFALRAELAGVRNGVLIYVEDHESVIADEVAESLGMSIPGANNALYALYKAGLVLRKHEKMTRGGRRYRYSKA